MKIRFTLSLDQSTVRAFRQVEDCEDGTAIAVALKETLREKIEEVKEQYVPDEEDDDDELEVE